MRILERDNMQVWGFTGLILLLATPIGEASGVLQRRALLFSSSSSSSLGSNRPEPLFYKGQDRSAASSVSEDDPEDDIIKHLTYDNQGSIPLRPTTVPTVAPIGRPTAAPSFAPTSPSCNLETSIECQTPSGESCRDLTYVGGTSCATDSTLFTLDFRYVPSACAQGDTNCQDVAPIDDTATVQIDCTDENQVVPLTIDPTEVDPMGFFSVTALQASDGSAGQLPQSIVCSMTSVTNGVIFQQVRIESTVTSNDPIRLGDTTGSIMVAGCDELTCLQDADQYFNITNIGSGPMQIVGVNRNFNGDVTDLLPFVPENPLARGRETSVGATTPLDLCMPKSYRIELFVKGKPFNGPDCELGAAYLFDITIPSTDTPTLEPTMAPTKVETLKPTKIEVDTVKPTKVKTLKPTKVDTFKPTKVDTLPPTPIPTKVDTKSPTIAPTSAKCTVMTMVGCTTTSGESCSDLVSGGSNCSSGEPINEVLTLQYNISNAGSSNMTITEAQASYNALNAPLLPFIPDKVVIPGDTVSLEENVTIDLCEGMEYKLKLFAKAESDNGPTCQMQSTYSFEISAPPRPPPTKAPTMKPMPTEEPIPLPPIWSGQSDLCDLIVNTTCIPPAGADNCQDIVPPQRECEGRPTKMTLLYTGGLCNQSSTPQRSLPGMFSCADVGTGPPTLTGAKSYIVVTALHDSSIVYHEGYVAVGDQYVLEDNGNLFVADQNITIYNSSEMGFDTMLQTVHYASSCSNTVFLKDQFGASLLVGWVNEEQGSVSCYANVSFGFTIAVPLEDEVHSVKLATLSSSTSFGTFNLTDDVNGVVVSSGESIERTIDAQIDLTVSRRNTLLTTATGHRPGAMECRGIDFYAFVAGTLDTNAPTPSPTITSAPTPDPDTTPCVVAAEIRCLVSDSNRLCTNLSPPTTPRCAGDAPTELRFLYSPGPCSQSNTTSTDFNCVDESTNVSSLLRSHIRVTDQDRAFTYFNGPVRRGEIFTVGNGQIMADKLFLEIYADAGGEPGDRVQSMALHTVCDVDSDISLLTKYGSLQLTEYTNPQQGLQSAIVSVDQSFVIRNDGQLVATVQWTNATSTLYGTSSLVSPPGLPIAPGLEFPFVFESTQINLYESIGKTFVNSLNTYGVGYVSDLACHASASFNFTIGS